LGLIGIVIPDPMRPQVEGNQAESSIIQVRSETLKAAGLLCSPMHGTNNSLLP